MDEMVTPTLPQTVSLNGARLAFVEQGKGELVVIVHGSLGDYRNWLGRLPRYAERYRAIALNRRGHYPNPWPDDYENACPRSTLLMLPASSSCGPAGRRTSSPTPTVRSLRSSSPLRDRISSAL